LRLAASLEKLRELTPGVLGKFWVSTVDRADQIRSPVVESFTRVLTLHPTHDRLAKDL
jgi:hypothetical protein